MTRSSKMLWVALAMVVLLFQTPSASANLNIYRDGQFALGIPSGWHVMEHTVHGERLFFASPHTLSVTELFNPKGFDTPAIIDVTITQIPYHIRNQPLASFASHVIAMYEGLVGDASLSFSLLEGIRPITVSNRPAVTATFQQDDSVTVMLMTRYDGHLFRIGLTRKENLAAEYSQLLAEVFASFEVFEAPPVPILAEFRTNVANIRLPQGWYQREYETHQAFISREEIRSDDDLFSVGLTMTAFSNYDQQFGVPIGDVTTMYQLYFMALGQAMETVDPQAQIIGAEVVIVDGTESLLIESSHDTADGMLQTLTLATARESTLYTATFEAPVAEFYVYRPIFFEAMSTMSWR